MNQDKAREFFSAYYEDALEAGLKQSFEARLKADALLRSEYQSFVSAMESLDFLRDEEIEIPQNLSSKIATRLESVQEKKARSPFSLAFLRPLAFGGLATVALAGAFFALKPGSAGPATGNVLPSVSSESPVGAFQIDRDGNAVVLRTRQDGEHTLVVDVDGQRDRVVLNARTERKLDNPNAAPALFRVGIDGAARTTDIAVPGTATTDVRKGSGTVRDLALALAGTFSVPVAVTVGDSTNTYEWNLEGSDAAAAAAAALRDDATVDLSSAGVLTIQGH